MGRFQESVRENKRKAFVVIIALLAFIFCCVMSDKYISKKSALNQNKEVATETRTENQGLKATEKNSADTTVQDGKVVVHYVDEKGEQIIQDKEITGNVGELYEVERKELEGYVSVGEEPLARAGAFEIGTTEVTFRYKEARKEVLTKVENEGENGAKETQVSIAFNNTKSKQDCKLKIITKDENGNVINGGVFQVGKSGNLLREGQVRNGSFYAGKIAVGEEGKLVYEVEQISATVGYKKIDEKINVGINSIWNETSKKFDITVDESTVKNVKITKNGTDEIIVEVTNAKYKDMYEMELINKCGTELISGGKFKVEKQGELIAEGVAENGSLYIGEFDIKDEKIERYNVFEEETAEGYERVIENETSGIVEVIKKFNSQSKKYDVSVKYSDIKGFSAVLDSNGKVVIYIESEKTPDEEIKEYDLAIKKFVSEIDGVKTENREPKVSVVEEEKEGKNVKTVKYEQNNEMEKAGNEQKVTYTLRTYNESNVNGYGRRIIEQIPEGLVFLPDDEINKEYGWKLYKQDKEGDLLETSKVEEATVVVSDYMIDKEIEGFNFESENEPKYKDVKIVFEIDESKITSKDRIIENVVEISDDGNSTGTEDGNKRGKEINGGNNKTSEKIYVKYFDLEVTKYIKEVTVKNSVKETKQEIGESQKGKLVKIDVVKKEVPNTTIRVTYGLKVKNVGEIEGYATELIDYIPKDFKLVEDGIWNVKNDIAVTNKLQNTLLKPGESTVVEITFDWKLTDDNIGRRINEGKITKYENEFNARDLTEDNNDKEEMLVQVRTGSAWVFYVIAVLVGLWVITGVVFLIKKMKENDNEEI